MSVISVKLNDYLEKAGEQETKSFLSSFFCSRDRDVQDFIRRKAIPFERSDHARTTLICWLDDNTGGMEIIAYYSIAVREFDLKELSKSQIKKFRGNQTNGNQNANVISAILVGQLGKNDQATYPINSNALFNELFTSILGIYKIAPIRLIYLHCKDHPKLRILYESKDFRLLSDKNGDPVLHHGGEQEYLVYVMKTKRMLDILSENDSS